MTLPSPIATGSITGVEAQLLQIATVNATNIAELSKDLREFKECNKELQAKVDQQSIDIRAMKASYDEAKAIAGEIRGISGKGATGISIGVSSGIVAVVEGIKWLVMFLGGAK